jgi:hypothetical protein
MAVGAFAYDDQQKLDESGVVVDKGMVVIKLRISDSNGDSVVDAVYDSLFGTQGYIYARTTYVEADGETNKYSDPSAIQIQEAIGSMLGNSVAITKNGGFAIAGAPNGNNGAGSVWVFEKNGSGGFSKVHELPLPNDIQSTFNQTAFIQVYGSPNFGYAVDMSDDGEFILATALMVSPSGDASLRQGKAYLYKKDIGVNTWTLVNTIVAPSVAEGRSFGQAACISGDAKWVAVSSPDHNQTPTITGTGKVFLYKRINNAVTADSSLVGPNVITGTDIGRRFGHSMSMSSKNLEYPTDFAGYVLAISRPLQKSSGVPVGAVDVYHSYNNTGSLNYSHTIPFNNALYNNFGIDVSVSDRGTEIAILSSNKTTGNTVATMVMYEEVSNALIELVRYEREPRYSVGYDLYPKSISIGHDGRTVAIGSIAQNDLNNSVICIYHKIGKDVPYSIIGGMYNEQYSFEKAFSTPSTNDPNDSGQDYGVVAISGDNNTIIVGASGNEMSGNLAEDRGKVYFYSTEAKTVDFTMSVNGNQTTVVENTIGYMTNYIQINVWYTSGLDFLKESIITLSGVDYVLNGDPIHTTYGSLYTSGAGSNMTLKFYPSSNIYNWNDATNSAKNVAVDLKYTTVSTSNNRSSNTITFYISDGVDHQGDVFMPSKIDNATNIDQTTGEMTSYVYNGHISYNVGSDDVNSESLSFEYRDESNNVLINDVVPFGTAGTQTMLPHAYMEVSRTLTKQPITTTVNILATNRTVTGYSTGEVCGVEYTTEASAPEMGINTKLKSLFSYSKNATDGVEKTHYVVALYGLVPKEYIINIYLNGVFRVYDYGVFTTEGSPRKITLNNDASYEGYDSAGEDLSYNYDVVNNVTTFTLYTNTNGALLNNSDVYTVEFVCSSNIGNFIPGYYKTTETSVSSTNVVTTDTRSVIGCLKFRSGQSTMVSGSSKYKLDNDVKSEFFSFYSTSGVTYRLLLEGIHERDAIHSVSVFGKLAKGTTPLKMDGAANTTFIKDTTPTYFVLHTSSAVNTTVSGPRNTETTVANKHAKRLAALIPTCTGFFTSTSNFTVWEWKSAATTNDYGMLIPSELYSVNIYNGVGNHTLTGKQYYSYSEFGNSFHNHGMIDYKERGPYDYNNGSFIYNVTPKIYPSKVGGYEIAGIYTTNGMFDEENNIKENPRFTFELYGNVDREFIKRVDVTGMHETGTYAPVNMTKYYVVFRDNFIGYYTDTVTDVSGKNSVISRWVWEIDTTGQSNNQSYGTMFTSGSSTYDVTINEGLEYRPTHKQVSTHSGGTTTTFTINAKGSQVYPYDYTRDVNNLGVYSSDQFEFSNSCGYSKSGVAGKPAFGSVMSGTAPAALLSITSRAYLEQFKTIKYPNSPSATVKYGKTGYQEIVIEMTANTATEKPINYISAITISKSRATDKLGTVNPITYTESGNTITKYVDPWQTGIENSLTLNPLVVRRQGTINGGISPPSISGVPYINTADIFKYDIPEYTTDDSQPDVYCLYANQPHLSDYFYNPTTKIVTWVYTIGAPMFDVDGESFNVEQAMSFVTDNQYSISITTGGTYSQTNKLVDSYRANVENITSVEDDVLRYVRFNTIPNVVESVASQSTTSKSELVSLQLGGTYGMDAVFGTAYIFDGGSTSVSKYGIYPRNQLNINFDKPILKNKDIEFMGIYITVENSSASEYTLVQVELKGVPSVDYIRKIDVYEYYNGDKYLVETIDTTGMTNFYPVTIDVDGATTYSHLNAYNTFPFTLTPMNLSGYSPNGNRVDLLTWPDGGKTQRFIKFVKPDTPYRTGLMNTHTKASTNTSVANRVYYNCEFEITYKDNFTEIVGQPQQVNQQVSVTTNTGISGRFGTRAERSLFPDMAHMYMATNKMNPIDVANGVFFPVKAGELYTPHPYGVIPYNNTEVYMVSMSKTNLTSIATDLNIHFNGDDLNTFKTMKATILSSDKLKSIEVFNGPVQYSTTNEYIFTSSNIPYETPYVYYRHFTDNSSLDKFGTYHQSIRNENGRTNDYLYIRPLSARQRPENVNKKAYKLSLYIGTTWTSTVGGNVSNLTGLDYMYVNLEGTLMDGSSFSIGTIKIDQMVNGNRVLKNNASINCTYSTTDLDNSVIEADASTVVDGVFYGEIVNTATNLTQNSLYSVGVDETTTLPNTRTTMFNVPLPSGKYQWTTTTHTSVTNSTISASANGIKESTQNSIDPGLHTGQVSTTGLNKFDSTLKYTGTTGNYYVRTLMKKYRTDN